VLRLPLRPYLTESLGDAAAWAVLAAARAQAPADPLLDYLWGRRLYLAERHEEAAAALATVPAATSLPADVRLAAIELLGMADLRGGHAERVETTLQALADFALEDAERLGFEDLALRAAWAAVARRDRLETPVPTP